MREWNARNPGYATEQGRKHRARAREYERWKYHNDDDWRYRKLARNQFQQARARGLIINQPCEMCGAFPAEAHHDDYSKPLDVRWLCKQHHEAHHADCHNEPVAQDVTEHERCDA